MQGQWSKACSRLGCWEKLHYISQPPIPKSMQEDRSIKRRHAVDFKPTVNVDLQVPKVTQWDTRNWHFSDQNVVLRSVLDGKYLSLLSILSNIFLYLYLYLSIYLSIYPSIYLSISLSSHLSILVYLSCLPIDLSIGWMRPKKPQSRRVNSKAGGAFSQIEWSAWLPPCLDLNSESMARSLTVVALKSTTSFASVRPAKKKHKMHIQMG